MGDANEIKDIDMQTKENEEEDDDLKRQLWRKFRPKLWFSSIWKKYSLESRLNGVKTFLRIHIVPASVSVAMGMCYLLLKSKGSKCNVTLYSDLLKGLQDGTVTRVQFKENSRRIVYDSVPRSSESEKVSTNVTKGVLVLGNHFLCLCQLLTEMDGFEKEETVVVIAATNRPETLDSALMRPGRFSRKVHVDEPNESGRKDIFALYLRVVPMEENKDSICQVVASLSPGLVGADLENIVRESVLLAARRVLSSGGEFVTKDDIFEAVDRAKGKVYDSADGKPFPFGSTTPYRGDGGSMGFGVSN